MPKNNRGGKRGYSDAGKGRGGKTGDFFTPDDSSDSNPLNSKGAPRSIEERLSTVNPHYYDSDAEEKGYDSNCQRCVWAAEAQARGYDVEALPNTDNLGSGGRWFSAVKEDVYITAAYVYKDSYGYNKICSSNAQVAKAIEQSATSWGEGARGAIVFNRRNKTGHTFNFEVHDGKVIGYDTQDGSKVKSLSKYLSSQHASIGTTGFFRTDTLTFNENEVSKYFKKRRTN